jgi:hypothetical protein
MSDTGRRSPANDSTTAAPALPPLYKDPRPVDPNIIGGWGLKQGGNYRFAANTHAVSISLTEFPYVQKYYPIVFVPGEQILPIAVVGLEQDENLFVGPDGQWINDAYIPGYVRRYPFVFADVRETNQMLLCVDAAAEIVAKSNPDQPFFNGTEPTAILTQALEFCKRFQEDLILTQAFTAELKKLNLFHEVDLRYQQPDGTSASAGRVVTINMAAFEKLEPDVFLDLRMRGMLPLIYFVQNSFTNWQQLSLLKNRRMAQAAGAGVRRS